MEKRMEKINQKTSLQKKTKVKFADIRYTDESYNPEGIDNKRTYRYIIDGDGKEKLMIEEETEIDKEQIDG